VLIEYLKKREKKLAGIPLNKPTITLTLARMSLFFCFSANEIMYFMFRGRKAAVRNLMIRGETANDQLTGLYNQHQSHSAKTEISS